MNHSHRAHAGWFPVGDLNAGRSTADIMFDGFLSGTGKVQSFRECYVRLTGDRRITGKLENCNQELMREALGSASFSSALGAAINRRMVAEYRDQGRYSVWRKLATIANVVDFRTQNRVRWGGYGDLPAVAEGDPYAALTSPTDESASYSVGKKGGTETVTVEMIRNDDVRIIKSIPKRLAQAADRTLAHFVLNFLRDNPAIYDGLALFHANHGNLGTGRLSASALQQGRVAIQGQQELGSNDRMGLVPRFLWVPLDLEETAANLFRRAANQDKTFVQGLDIEVVPVWYWTDPNDWCLSADPASCPTIEVGFLDGEEDPRIEIQDNPTSGSMFSHDQLTFKIRHIYGGAVTDYRGLYKSAN